MNSTVAMINAMLDAFDAQVRAVKRPHLQSAASVVDWTPPLWAVERGRQIEELRQRGWPIGSFQYWSESMIAAEHAQNRSCAESRAARTQEEIETLLEEIEG